MGVLKSAKNSANFQDFRSLPEMNPGWDYVTISGHDALLAHAGTAP
jgi:hypothetical protein